MNIDQESLQTYKKDASDFSSALKQGVNFKKSKFKVGKNGRCHFLNGKNLCEIMINLGEKSLCQVCTDHPRFRSFFNDRIETGLGFCCEEATRNILTFTDKIELTLTADDGENQQLDFNQKNVLEFRKKALKIVQNRALNINDRIQKLLEECFFNYNSKQLNKAIKLFLTFERIDKNWTKKLKHLKNKKLKTQIDQEFSLQAEQFLVNSLYRHLSDAEDTLWVRARAVACVISWWIVLNVIIQNQGDIFDTVRAYSTEVEYSQKNLDKLFNFAYKFIKI